MNSDFAYCLRTVRQWDRDRYLSILFAPARKRPALAALYAFYIEIDRIAKSVREPMVGEIKLKWWQDSVENETARASNNPIIDQLAKTIVQFSLPKQALSDMCEARRFDLYSDAMPTRNDFEGYCGETSSTLIRLICQILSHDVPISCDDAAGHGGVVQALTALMLRLPFGEQFIPADLLKLLGATRSDLVGQSGDSEARNRVASALLAWSKDHYKTFRANMARLPRKLLPAFLPLATIPMDLRYIEKNRQSLFTKPAEFMPLTRQWVLTKTAITGTFPKLT